MLIGDVGKYRIGERERERKKPANKNTNNIATNKTKISLFEYCSDEQHKRFVNTTWLS